MKFLSLTNRNMKEIYRDPLTLLLGMAMPLGLLFLFTSLFKNTQVNIFSPQSLTPGIIVFSFAFIIMFSAILLAKDKQTAILTRLFTTPLSATDFIVAYLIPFFPLAAIQTATCFILGLLLGASYSQVLIALVILFLVALTCISIGILLGSLFTVNQVSGIGSIFITVISLFSGAWMDLHMVGGVFKAIGYAMPFAHGIDAAKGIMAGNPVSEYAKSNLIVLAYALVFFVLAILAFRWRMKKE